jgi:hypothetical protein
MTVPPMVAVAIPIPMPISRTLCEHMFLPVSAEMIVSISKLAAGISLVPRACRRWISVIRKSREAINLIGLSDGCRSEWTGSGVRYPIRTHIWRRNTAGWDGRIANDE